MPSQSGLAILILSLATSGACTSHTLLRSSGQLSPTDNSPGIRYYVPRDLLVLDVASTYHVGKGWHADITTMGHLPPADSHLRGPLHLCEAGSPQNLWTDGKVQLTPLTIPDRRVAYRLYTQSSSWQAQTLKLAVSSEGLLTSINYTAEDQRAQAAANVVKAAAGIAGAALGLDQILQARADFGTERAKFLRAFGESIKTGTRPDTLEYPRLWRTRAEACFRRTAPLAVDSLFRQRIRLEAALIRALDDRQAGLAVANHASTLIGAKVLAARDDLQNRRIAMIDARLTTIREAIAAGARTATAAVSADRDTVVRKRAVLDVSQVPPQTVVAGHLGAIKDAHLKLASSYPAIAGILDSTAVLVTLDESVAPGSAPTSPGNVTPSSDPKCAAELSEDECVTLYQRAPIPRVLRVYAPVLRDTATTPLRLYDSQVLSLVSDADPIRVVSIETSTLGKQAIALNFGRPGTITGFEESATAGLADAAGTLATALTTARQEFVSGLQAAQTVQTTTDAMQAEARSARIKQLSDEKSLLDAQIALQGATVSRDLVLQRQQLEAQVALLKAQQALVASEDAGAVSTSIADLKAEVQRLQAQIELLKTQMELAKLQKAAQATGAATSTP